MSQSNNRRERKKILRAGDEFDVCCAATYHSLGSVQGSLRVVVDGTLGPDCHGRVVEHVVDDPWSI